MQGQAIDGEEDEEEYIPTEAPPPPPSVTAPPVVPSTPSPAAEVKSDDGPASPDGDAEATKGNVSPPAGVSPRTGKVPKKKRSGFGKAVRDHQKSGFDDLSDDDDGGAGAMLGRSISPPGKTTSPRGIDPSDHQRSFGANRDSFTGPPAGSLLAAPAVLPHNQQQGQQPQWTAPSATQSTQQQQPQQQSDTHHDSRMGVGDSFGEGHTDFSQALKAMIEKPPKSVAANWRQLPKASIATSFPSYRDYNTAMGRDRSNSLVGREDSLGANAIPTPRSVTSGGSLTPRTLSGITPRLSSGSLASPQMAKVTAKLTQLDADVYEVKRSVTAAVMKPSAAMCQSLSNSADAASQRVAQCKTNVTWTGELGTVLAEAVNELCTRTAPSYFRV